MKYLDALILAAKMEVGVVEHGQANWGPRVSQYLADVGINFPASWCAAFARFCMVEAAHAVGFAVQGLLVPQVPILNTLAPRDFASCAMIGAYAYRADMLYEQPQAGDLFLIRNDEGHFHHTGIVSSVSAGCGFKSYEGNTNDDGSSNGYGVFARDRDTGPHVRFVRFADEFGVSPSAPQAVDPSYLLSIGGKFVGAMPLVSGRSYFPVRLWASALGVAFGYDPKFNNVTFGNPPRTFDGELALIDGVNHAPIRSLVRFFGLSMRVDNQKRMAEVYR